MAARLRAPPSRKSSQVPQNLFKVGEFLSPKPHVPHLPFFILPSTKTFQTFKMADEVYDGAIGIDLGKL